MEILDAKFQNVIKEVSKIAQRFITGLIISTNLSQQTLCHRTAIDSVGNCAQLRSLTLNSTKKTSFKLIK